MIKYFIVGALITQKPSSVIIEEGQNVTLVCRATGKPQPTVTWNKAFGHMPSDKYKIIDGNLNVLNITREQGGDYICKAKNLLNEDSASAQITVIERLSFITFSPARVLARPETKVELTCVAKGALEITWQRIGKSLPQSHVLYPNGTLLLNYFKSNDAGTYKCTARNFRRSITTSTVLQNPVSCGELKSKLNESSTGYHVIDPDGERGVAPFSVYCDMSDKGGVGVTIISHDSESRTYVSNIPGCGIQGCYSRNVTYTGVSTAQLAALVVVSKNCEQLIKFECYGDVAFVEDGFAWWVSRDGRKMNYWGGAPGGSRMCACGVTNSCVKGAKCNCHNKQGDWREDSGILTDKSALPVSEIRLGDLDGSQEKGYHTLGKMKCYGIA